MTKEKDNSSKSLYHDEASIPEHTDKYLDMLHKIIRFSVRVLAGLMTFVIIWGIVDVVHVLYVRIMTKPVYILQLTDLLAVFGTFLTVLIAIEIFLNITLYLRDDVIHVKLVVATALMAAARKVIILDYKVINFQFVYASAVLVLCLGIIYWLISKKE